uniref:Uncharacterized protein n=1 Tax=Arundo donax TaxID=35708 RepID=A0A0A9B0F9_ARUDO
MASQTGLVLHPTNQLFEVVIESLDEMPRKPGT